MIKLLSLLGIFLFHAVHTFAQPDIAYYLSDSVTYNQKIPLPKSVLGHEVGELHVSHDKLVEYMYAIDKVSDRVSLEVMGYTHELRPLLLLTITSPENHQVLERIKSQHVQLTDPAVSSTVDTRNMPAVFYLGCSIHGNEPSGTNASLLVAYHLAAAEGPEIEKMLKNTVVLLDPAFNPDGIQRFSSWVNSRKSRAVSADPNDMEHNEPWPGGRTNHYWFDLNRDWLVAQQPESQARIRKFHEWKPNVLTDHHEMGTNSTFFFQPGVPSRMHPLTPAKNLELTRKMASYHAKALDAIGSFYYTQEGFDDFYYGKGSTFPDVQGAIGILFEQASSRGHAQESVNGILKFPFTIRNQFTTAMSSLKAVSDLREELLNYQRQFFKDAMAEATKDPVKAIVFGSTHDPARSFHLAEIIARHKIKLYRPASTLKVENQVFTPESGYIVPLNQPQYKLIKAMFERRTRFVDSIFYDISTWTLPLALGLDYQELKTMPALGEPVDEPKLMVGKISGDKSDYAYVFEPFGYYSPRAVYRLLENGIRVKVATEPFYHTNGKRFERGSILVQVPVQEKSSALIDYLMREIAEMDGVDIYSFNTGLDFKGVSLGSNSFMSIRKPEIAILADAGVGATEAGEIWHLLDTRFGIPVTMMPVSIFNSANISRYNTIVFPPGTYSNISEGAREKLKNWIQNGGIAIGLERTLNWFNGMGIGKFEMKKVEQNNQLPARAYADIDEYHGAQQTDGAIFEANADLTNPLLYGYYNSRIPVFKGNNIFMEKAKGPYSNPLVFSQTPLLSGYISMENYSKLKDTSVVGVSAYGRGRVIGFTENLVFRAFWLGTNRLLMNAIFFGPLLNEAASR